MWRHFVLPATDGVEMCEVANKSKLSSFTVINVLFLPVPEKVSMPPALLRSVLFWLFIKIQLFIEYNLQLMYCQEVMTVSVLLFETTCLSNSCLCIFKPPYLAKSYLSSLFNSIGLFWHSYSVLCTVTIIYQPVLRILTAAPTPFSALIFCWTQCPLHWAWQNSESKFTTSEPLEILEILL